MTTAYERVLDALAGGKINKQGNRASARCPAHDDHKPSLSITAIEGRALLHCQAGCDVLDVVAALKLTMSDLFDSPAGVAYQYGYRTVYRTPNKDFRQSGNTKIYDLYRLPRVQDAVASGTAVYLVEGEQDVHAMEALGVVATTAPQGVVGFGKVDVSPLRGARVVAIPDQDSGGEQWAKLVQERLGGYAAEVTFLKPAAGKDPTDHLARGYGLADFVALPMEEPPAGRRVMLTPASSFQIKPVRWGWDQRMPIGEITIIPGREGIGKSLFLAWMAAQITRGTLPGAFHGEPRPVLYAASEDSWEYTVAARLLAAGADLDLVYRIYVEDPGPTRLVLPKDCHGIAEQALQVGAAALMLDPIVSLVDEKISPNQSFELRRALEPLRHAAEVAGVMVAALAHFNKAEGADVLSMIPGGRAWAEVARAGMALARDDDAGHCVLSQIKNNLGKLDLPNLTYVIGSVVVEADDGTPSDVGRLEWTGESEVGAASLLERRRGNGGGRPTSETTNEIIEYVESQGRAMSVQEVADHFPKINKDTVQKTLKRAAGRGELSQPAHGLYGPAWSDSDQDVA